ncbi:MAG: hypothetical protein ACXADW_24225, partial [Candidatus Hodarchaeales archaeon]
MGVNSKETQELWEENILMEINEWVNETKKMDMENLMEGLLSKAEVQAREELIHQAVIFLQKIFSLFGEVVPMKITPVEEYE